MNSFCEFITNPDWWSVIATFAAAFVAAMITWYLGKRQNKLQEQQLEIQAYQNELQEQQVKLQKQQNEIQQYQTKLQEQQTKQQEYEIYRRLYVIVGKINNKADLLLSRLYEYFSYPIDRAMYDNFLDFLFREINALDQEFHDCYTDFELKFTHNMRDAQYYRSMISDMRLLVQFIERLEEKKQMEYIEDTKSPHPGILARRGDESVLVEALVAKVTYEPYKDAVRTRLTYYLSGKDDVLKLNTLGKIRERCKID